MSSLVKPMKFDYLSNRDVEKFLYSDDEDNDFNFKYVPTSQFQHILKDVRRQRCQRNDEKTWNLYLNQKVPSASSKSPKFPHSHHSNLPEINLELQNFENDPPHTHRISKTTRISKSQTPRSQDSDVLSRKSSVTVVHKENDDEGDDSTLERSPVSKLDVKSKNSSSESTIRSSTKRRKHFRKLKRLECNSSPELSSQYESDEEDDLMEIQAHPLVAQKILCIQGRILELLDEISYRLCRIPRPDGENDLKRRQRRVLEFGIRFSRNYLYDLGRQVADIQRHLKGVVGEGKSRRGAMLHMQALEQKLCSSHQLLVCALNAYCNHIPSSVLQGHPGKLKEILGIVVELGEVCERINLTTEGIGDTGSQGLGNDLQSRCFAILSKLHGHSDNESQPFSAPQSVVSGPTSPTNLKRRISRMDTLKSTANRFSMYSIDAKYAKAQKQRRPVTVGVYPKDRSLSRARLENPPPTPEQIYSNTNIQKSFRDSTRRKKRKNGLQKEDDIKTVMNTMPNDSVRGKTGRIDIDNDNFGVINQLDSGNSKKYQTAAISENKIMRKRGKECAIKNSKVSIETGKTSINECDNKEQMVSEDRLANLVPVIADLMTLVAKKNNAGSPSESASMETLIDIIQKYQSDNNQYTPKIKVDLQKSSNIKRSESRTGPKNMQLICINDENHENSLKFMDASCQASQENLIVNERKDCLTELIVSETSMMKLLNYRDEYSASSRSSPMYTSNSQNKPWEVVAWIADKLVDELIVDISKELQIDDVIKKLFELEFLEF